MSIAYLEYVKHSIIQADCERFMEFIVQPFLHTGTLTLPCVSVEKRGKNFYKLGLPYVFQIRYAYAL